MTTFWWGRDCMIRETFAAQSFVSTLLISTRRKETRPPEHGGDLDQAGAKSIHDAVGADDDFAKVAIVALRDDSAGLRELGESLDRHEKPLDHQLCVELRVLGDVRADRIEISERLRGPEDPVHRRKRRLTSSCGMPLPASSSLRPASIFARKTRRSMASSTVASGGKSRSASKIRSREL